MTDETDTLPAGGTDNVALSETDTPETWDYHDPDDDQDTVADQPTEGTDDEAGEAEGQETEGEEPKASLEASLDAVVTLADGTKTTVADLHKGYLRQSDYTRKAQEVANERQALKSDVQRLEGITQAFIDHLAAAIPAEPSAALAMRDPATYTAQKAQYDAAMAQVLKLIELGQQPKAVGESLSKADTERMLGEENDKLTNLFPKTATREGRQKFFEDVQSVAGELGYSTDELRGVTDHRLFALAHWAKVGMDAAKAREKAQAKVEKAPPATPRKPGQGAATANRNAEAMRKLGRSGSIKDALAIDWD